MNLSKYSTAQLIDLLQSVAAEIAVRHSEPMIERVKAERPLVVLREPAENDKDFVLYIKALAYSGGYINAFDRNRVAEIAVEYGPWVTRQGLPTEKGTGPWRKLSERCRVEPARER